MSHYWGKNILPYIKLPGPVEMDETLISRKRWNPWGSMPKLKWAFGLFCRETKIPIVFYIKDKSHWTLAQITKAYTKAGTPILTDCHSSYVTLNKGLSKLSPYGYYHFWINHSEFYVHGKFPFVCTGKIETCWRMLKSSFNNIKWNASPRKVDDILNCFCLRTIIKNYKVYNFTLRRIRDYYASAI
jgi:hypothetical protein